MNACVPSKKKPIRIGLITYAMYGGGMETFLLRLGKLLTQNGMEVELVTTQEPGDWFERAAATGMKALHLPGWKQGSRLRNVLRSCRVGTWMQHRKYDVVFLNHAFHAGAAIGLLSKNVFVVPVFHNDAESIYQVGCLSPQRWNVAVGVSPKVAEAIRIRQPDRPVELFPYGIEMPAEPDWATRRKADGKQLDLIFIGRLEQQQKGVFFLPDILQQCLERGVNCTLTVVGDGPDGAKLAHEFNARGVGGHVHFVGMLPPDQIYAHLLKSHILLMPSFFEGLPISLLEALACGCVPVVSHLPGITDFAVTTGVNGKTVKVGDVAGFVDAIEQLSNNPDMWKHMSESARQTAEDRFSLSAMGKAYIKLIHDGLNGVYPIPDAHHWYMPIDARLVLGWRR